MADKDDKKKDKNGVLPTKAEVASWETFMYNGLVTDQGNILTALDHNTLMYGKARDVSPSYWRFLDEANKYATLYPTNDPRTWVPLLKADIKADDPLAEAVMGADSERIANEGGEIVIGEKAAAEDAAEVPEDEGTGGFLGFLGGAIDTVTKPLQVIASEGPEQIGETVGWLGTPLDENSPGTFDPAYDAVGAAKDYLTTPIDENRPGTFDPVWDETHDVFKGAVRNTIASSVMPLQAVAGTMANVSQDISEGDWKSAMLHTVGIVPLIEAGFIGAENVFNSKFYREGKKEMTNWQQTDQGQIILDATGQGRGEQVGAYDDPVGIQGDLGDGYLIPQSDIDPGMEEGDETSIGQWQSYVRREANTILEGGTISPEEQKALAKIIRMDGMEEGLLWAQENGYTWDTKLETFTRPAQGWTIGRAAALTMYDPYTSGYNNFSGFVDGYANIVLDPLLFIPGGQVKVGLGTLRGGGKIIKGSADSAAYVKDFITKTDVMEMSERLRHGESIDDILKPGDRLVARNKRGEIMTLSHDDVKNKLVGVDKRGDALLSSDEAIEVIGTGRYAEYRKGGNRIGVQIDEENFFEFKPATKFTVEELGYYSKIAADQINEMSPEQVKNLVALSKDDKVVGSADKILELSAAGQLDKVLAKGGSIAVVERGKYRKIVDSDELASLTDEELSKTRKLMQRGGFFASSHAWDLLNSGRYQAITRALADMKDSSVIYKMGNGRITTTAARMLARAETPDDVRGILAPLVGVSIRNRNDMLRYATKLPAWDITGRLYQKTDLYKLKDLAVTKIPGMSFLPLKEVDRENLAQAVEQVSRLGRVAFTNIDADPEWVQKMNRLVDVDESIGNAGWAEKYQALFGKEGDEYVVNAAGQPIKTPEELSLLRFEFEGDDVKALASQPPGAKIVRHTEDGAITYLMHKMVKDAGLDPALATKLTRAWGDTADRWRITAQDGVGGAQKPPWPDGSPGDPWMEHAILSGAIPLPNIQHIRHHLSRWGKLTDDFRKTGNMKGLETLDDVATGLMQEWKRIVLLGAGARLPTYVMKATFDTHMAIALSGGTSFIRDPLHLINLILHSAVRKATAKQGTKENVRLKVARKATSNRAAAILWRGDSLGLDANGVPWEEGMRRFLDDDASAYDVWVDALNLGSSFKRGSQGQDVNYARAQDVGRVPRDLANPAHWDEYAEGIVGELHRLSRDPAARRLASSTADFDDIVRWFKESATSGRAVVSQMGDKAARFLSTDEGVREYLNAVRQNIRVITGDDPALLKIIATHGRVDKKTGLWDAASGVDKRPSKSALKVVEAARDADGANLPQTIAVIPRTMRQNRADMKSWWDDYNNMLFMHAGRWEDVYAREPFMRERYWYHVEDMADMMQPQARAKMAADLRAEGSTKAAKRLEANDSVGHFTRKEIHNAAQWKAFKDMTDVAYNAANRREWAYAARLISPFVQAAVNGMYRWTKAALQNPESTYRIVRLVEFLQSEDSAFINEWLNSGTPDGTPMMYEDPQTGQRRIAVAGMGEVAKWLGFPAEAGMAMSFSAGTLNLAFPTYEAAQLSNEVSGGSQVGLIGKAIFPGVGPVFSIPASVLLDGTEDWAAEWLLPYGATPGSGADAVWKALAPRAITKIAEAIAPSQDQLDRQGARVVAIYAQLAKEQGGVQNMSEADQIAAQKRAVNLSRNITIVEAFASLTTPSPLSTEILYKDVGDIPNHVLFTTEISKIYSRYIEANNYDFSAAEAEFVNDVGLETLMLVSPAGDNTDVAPPTFGASRLRGEYREGYDHYAPVLKYLLNSKDGTEFDVRLWGAQIKEGEREVPTTAERLAAATQAPLQYIYEYKSNQILNAAMGDIEKGWAMVKLNNDLTAAGWLPSGEHSTYQERDRNARLMAEATQDPRMNPYIGEQTSKLLYNYLRNRAAGIASMQSRGLRGDLLSATTAEERWRLFALGESYALQDPSFARTWWRTLRYEVAPAETVEE